MYKRNEVPALETLQKTLLEDYNINCSKATLKRRLNSSGFRFKALDKRQVILESRRLVEWRGQYLRDIKKFRSEGRFVCYLDETWYDTHDVIKKGWVDESRKCVLAAPIGKGKRIIILHAGSDKRWIGQYLLSGRNLSSCKLDYHEDMAADLFEKWFENQLLPDLPPNSVIVLDNASYHSRQKFKTPNSNSTKAELQNFLHQHDLYFEESYTKKELLQVLKKKTFKKQYYAESLAVEKGHTVLRLPPYYCIFNPIELIWSQLKRNIRRKNSSPSLNNSVVDIIINEIDNIESEHWSECCRHVIDIEGRNLHIHPVVNELTIRTGDSGSDSESDDLVDLLDIPSDKDDA